MNERDEMTPQLAAYARKEKLRLSMLESLRNLLGTMTDDQLLNAGKELQRISREGT